MEEFHSPERDDSFHNKTYGIAKLSRVAVSVKKLDAGKGTKCLNLIQNSGDSLHVANANPSLRREKC